MITSFQRFKRWPFSIRCSVLARHKSLLRYLAEKGLPLHGITSQRFLIDLYSQLPPQKLPLHLLPYSQLDFRNRDGDYSAGEFLYPLLPTVWRKCVVPPRYPTLAGCGIYASCKMGSRIPCFCYSYTFTGTVLRRSPSVTTTNDYQTSVPSRERPISQRKDPTCQIGKVSLPLCITLPIGSRYRY